MMKNRIKQMNQILKDLYISVKDTDRDLTKGSVYNYLVGMHANNRQKINSEDNSMFVRWIDRFKDRESINVYVHDMIKYFCQFNNFDKNINGTLDYVKLYIPLDYNHIEEGANRIFDFLASNDIKHQSKIATDVRHDDLVVRLYRKEDATKLKEFVLSDEYIREGMLVVNPFCFSEDGIGYAYDNRSSYNCYVSSLIADYINTKKEENVDVDCINIRSFYNYVNSVVQMDDVVLNLDKINSLLADDKKGKSVFLADVCIMNNLLKLSLCCNNMDRFWEFYDEVKKVSNRNGLEWAINNQLESKTKEELFKEFILITMKKYPVGHNKRQPNLSGFDYIISYLNGNLKAVTRDKNLRERVSNNLSPFDVYDIVINSGIIGNNMGNMLNNYIKKVMLDDIIKSMLESMPNNYVRNLESYLSDNNLGHITSNGMAGELAMTMRADDMRRFMYDMGVNSIEEYINKYYNNNEDRRKKR